MSDEATRGRETSPELVEVRTVLSRAKDARLTLWRYQVGELKHSGSWDYSTRPATYHDPEFLKDPEVGDMIEALDEAIISLDRWRRTGRPLKGK